MNTLSGTSTSISAKSSQRTKNTEIVYFDTLTLPGTIPQTSSTSTETCRREQDATPWHQEQAGIERGRLCCYSLTKQKTTRHTSVQTLSSHKPGNGWPNGGCSAYSRLVAFSSGYVISAAGLLPGDLAWAERQVPQLGGLSLLDFEE